MLPWLHKGTTRRLLSQRGFPEAVIRVAEQTAKWPDWYRWQEVIAHSATPIGPNGEPDNPVEAARACSGLLRNYLGRMREAPAAERLVWFGFALHLVQDLGVHQGRTNQEHSLQALLVFPNPDYSPALLRRASQLTARFLDSLPAPLLQELRSSDGARLLNDDEARALLGPKDISLTSLWDFILDGFRYLRSRNPKKRIRWDIHRVVDEATSPVAPQHPLLQGEGGRQAE